MPRGDLLATFTTKNPIQYFLDGFPMIIVRSSLALEPCPGMGLVFAALLLPRDKKKRTTEVVRFL